MYFKCLAVDTQLIKYFMLSALLLYVVFLTGNRIDFILVGNIRPRKARTGQGHTNRNGGTDYFACVWGEKRQSFRVIVHYITWYTSPPLHSLHIQLFRIFKCLDISTAVDRVLEIR